MAALTAPPVADPASTRVGFIGTGVMGSSMAGHLLSRGYALTVYNRTPAKAQGAVLASSPAAVAERSDVVISIVGFPEDVRETYLGAQGVLAALRPGGVAVDMTTSSPALARELAAAAAARGLHMVDAPVSGGDAGAKAGTLAIMCGGDEAAVSALAPLFSAMGTARRLGGPGAGQSCKLANQVTIATTMVGLVEGLLYAHAAGLDLDAYLGAIRGGAAGSRSLELYSGRLLARDWAPGFFVKHFVKDLGLALDAAREMRLALPGLALAQQLYVALAAQPGGADMGTQALLLALERLNSRELPARQAPPPQ